MLVNCRHSSLIDAARTLSHRRRRTSLPWAAVPHALQVAQKAMTGMWITSSQTAARKLGGYVSEHQIEIPHKATRAAKADTV
jgi:hypothetical protein